MAKYTGSPFGSISGQQLGLVGSKWKGIDYVRKYVVPANPDSAGQQTQRGKFKNVTEFARRIVDSIINPYTIPAPKKMSAFNDFLKRNVPLQTSSTMDESLIAMSQGSLYNPGITSFSGLPSTGYDFTWSETLFGEAALTDIAVCVVYNKTQDRFIIDASRTRDDESASVTDANAASSDVIYGWLFFVNAAGTMVSDSDVDDALVS